MLGKGDLLNLSNSVTLGSDASSALMLQVKVNIQIQIQVCLTVKLELYLSTFFIPCCYPQLP